MNKIAKFLSATVFDSEKSLEDYIRLHPNADRSNHSVKKNNASNPKNHFWAVHRFNKDTDDWDKTHNGPLGHDEALDHLKKLKKWDSEDGNKNKYRKVKLKSL